MLKLTGAESEKDRISFFTKHYSATAIRNENNEITIEFKKVIISKKNIVSILVIFGSPSLLKAFMLIPLIENKLLGIGCYLIPMFFFSLFAIIGIIDVRKNCGEEFLRNHGAEHKVFSAYEKLERVPTIQEVSKFSRINKSCGATIFSAFITVQLIGFIVYSLTSYIIPEIILFVVPLFFKTIFPLNLLGKAAQFFTTREPKKENIELAIASLSALEHKELLGDMFCKN